MKSYPLFLLSLRHHQFPRHFKLLTLVEGNPLAHPASFERGYLPVSSTDFLVKSKIDRFYKEI
jgi:hypothetical protein